MLENVKGQVALIITLVLAAIISLNVKGLNFGLDLKGGTELVYEVNEAEVELPPEEDWDSFMNTIVSTIRARIDPDGVLDAQVIRRSRAGIYIALPGLTDQQAADIEDKITRLGTLEMQICAYNKYVDANGETIFDLIREKEKLLAWLDENEKANWNNLLVDPLRISEFHQLSEDEGGPILGPDKFKWVPHRIEKQLRADSLVFDDPMSHSQGALPDSVVALFAEEELHAGYTEEKPSLVEFVPVNYDEVGFTGEDLIGNRVRPSFDQDGSPVVLYEIKPERSDEYADNSEKHIGDQSAIILDGFLKSAPVYQSRIPGRGQISGFTQAESAQLSDILKRGSLKVKPQRQSRVTIGPTLGAASIDRGVWSLGTGAALVLLFILYYYRVAGIVAMVGIALNVGFVFGAISFIGATLTLPGLGGLVLTIGMAVDANILIYERIREELRHGKELVLAVRHGFERAMVTILDANVTTFIAGLVLFNFGVGPIRGFAVTLMVGIITSLFTSFFVCRLIFHFLLASKVKNLGMTEWFKNVRFNFLRYSRFAMTCSAALIVAGVYSFFAIDPHEKYGLDFTGGASVRVVTKEAMDQNALAVKLRENAEFTAGFPRPQVNTMGDTGPGGTATEFSIKLKVSEEQAEQYAADAIAAEARDEIYKLPYVELIQTVLEDTLVPRAFTHADSSQEFGRVRAAQIRVHYDGEVQIAEVKQILLDKLGVAEDAVRVEAMVDGVADPAATSGTDLRLQFDVPTEVNSESALTSHTRDILADSALPLSNPIPDVAELGGRMVGELRSAAIGALIIALFCIVMFIRIRFHEYKYGLAAVAALVHDVLIALGLVVVFNYYTDINAELGLSMIAAFLTIIGYSINDTIVIFDRIRENLATQAKFGDTKTSFADTVNLSINQTLARTILTSCTTLFVVGTLFVVNFGSGSDLEGFAFAMIIGIITGTYSTIFIASPVLMWLRSREKPDAGLSDDGGLGTLIAESDAESPDSALATAN